MTTEIATHTAGPWFYDSYSRICSGKGDSVKDVATVPPSYGDTATREHQADAYLIASAPELLEACKAQHQAIDLLFATLIEKTGDFFPSKSGQPWEAMKQGNKAITKAEGR